MRKNKMNRSVPIEKSLKKLHRIMRLTFLFLLLGIGSLFAKESYSQTVNFNLNMHNATLEEVFDAIKKQSEFEFFFNNNQVNTSRKVNLKVKNASLEEVLSQVLNDQYNYKIEDKYVLISKKNQVTETAGTQQQGVTIKGLVADNNNEPLAGVSVTLVGHQSVGTTTNIDGNYTITVPDTKAILRFSYLGYTTIELPVGNKKIVDARMSEATEDLGEVVVVGYGIQKKVNLTGAVAAITGDDVAARPITNLSSGLQGLLPGVTIVNSANGGLPGQSNASIRVRGIGTIANANPLVLIDGVEGDMNIINPSDIESISVLKDAASAAIYGNRAANGVILVTTKSIKGKEAPPKIDFNAYWGLQTPTRLIEMADAPTYMAWDIEANENMKAVPNYKLSDIEKVINGSDPNYYANTNWIDQIFQSSAPQQNYNVNISGKGQNMGYMLSYGYLEQDGLLVGDGTKSKRNNVRLKLNTKVANLIDITANISYIDRDYSSPSAGITGDGGIIYNSIRSNPVTPVKFTDGGWGYGGGQSNQVALLYDGGNNNFRSQETTGNFSGKLDIIKGWTASMTYAFVQSNSLREILYRTIPYYYPDTDVRWYATTPTNAYENRDYTKFRQTLFAQTDYELKVEDHTFNVLAGFSQEWEVNKDFSARRDSLITEKNPSLEFGSKALQSNGAAASQWALRSGFGRLNYNYKDKYLLEANIRYDLTSRFAKEKRGGTFPSFSGAWRISEESFMEPYSDVINQLKLRGSWGILGNQYSTTDNNYPYLSTIDAVGVPTIGTVINNGYGESTIGNPELIWEKSKNTNIGLDLNILSTRLGLSADYFIRNTTGVIVALPYPGQAGFGGKTIEKNGGTVLNKGWEIQLTWNDKIGNDFTYGATFNLSDVKNELTDLGGADPTISSYRIRTEGQSLSNFYGLIADGLAMPWDFERYNTTTGKYEGPKFPILAGDAGNVQPGDIKYKDIDKNGSIDLDNDRTIVGDEMPRYTYLFNGHAGYKGFDLSFTIQGVGKSDGYLTGAARHAFTDQSTYPQKIHEGRYQASNPNPNATYPRFTYNQSYNQRFSTYWLENAAYLRVKNLQIGYSLPKTWISKLKMDKCRFYASGDNLLTLTDFYYAYDPESAIQSGGYYPQVKTFVFGVNVTFK